MLSDIANPPSLDELARKSALNTTKLKRGFKQLFGKPTFAFLQEHRLNEAKKLLQSGDVNVNEASRIVGYNSVSYFAKAFKRHFEILPSSAK